MKISPSSLGFVDKELKVNCKISIYQTNPKQEIKDIVYGILKLLRSLICDAKRCVCNVWLCLAMLNQLNLGEP